MKVKILLALLLLITSNNLNAQESKSTCEFEYSIEILKNPDNQVKNDLKVDFNWNFSKIDLKNTKIIIEIYPIINCYEGIDTKAIGLPILISSSDKDFHSTNGLILSHSKMKAKCFKYRTTLISNCEEISEWNIYSFTN